jgi:hypothetical protein
VDVVRARLGKSTNSCGCLRLDLLKARSTIHGHSTREVEGRESPEYRTWNGMKQRCLNPKHPAYKNYGGRGITVCARWQISFQAFLDDVGPRPTGGRRHFTLDRIDNNGPYEPNNVKWATFQENLNHTRSNRWLTYDGRTQTVAQWAREYNLTHNALLMRLRSGWDLHRALTEPVSAKHQHFGSR